ncbi:MAG: sigma-70 family RNA polymerase sigma factor [Actinomycetia bacterium]|nr:sigma-70 family RNA polymerase sigma factor [Actinomycetes bacterium]
MAIFHRSHPTTDGSEPRIKADAWSDSSVGAGAVPGAGTAADEAVPSGDRAASLASAGLVADDLLGDAQVSERERRRERRLVEAACRGEESAIEALYRTHFDVIYRYVFLRLGSPSAAEDVTSQVFLGMVQGLRRYRDQGRPFVAWLYGIAQKQIAFYQRGQRRTPEPVDLDAAAELVSHTAGPEPTAEQRQMRMAIVRALREVPEGQREVIMLRYILSLSVAETASVVGRTEGAVKQLQLRGLATLKDILGREGVGLV